MAKIKSNFKTEKHFVLTNCGSKIMAIIHVPPGINDISEKIKRAVLEDENAEIVNLINDYIIENSNCLHIFKASIMSDDTSAVYTNYYELTEASVY